MTEADHVEMLELAVRLAGMVVISGYPHPLYDDALRGWRRLERLAYADGGRERCEVLWISPAAMARSAGMLALGSAA